MVDIKKAPDAEGRNKMAIAFMESACFQGDEMDKGLLRMIRKGMIVFNFPDNFEATQEGLEAYESRDA